jgi:hypothetical protein
MTGSVTYRYTESTCGTIHASKNRITPFRPVKSSACPMNSFPELVAVYRLCQKWKFLFATNPTLTLVLTKNYVQ